MNENQYFLTVVTVENRPQEINRLGEATMQLIQPFTQGPAREVSGNEIRPHTLFLLFTADIIGQNEVFIR